MSSYFLDAFWSPNKNAGDYEKVGFTIHHAATTDFGGIGRTFQSPARQASAHYGVEPGHVQQYVEDPYVAWHAGDAWANAHTIGIECVNSGGEADGWPVAEDTIDTLVEFMADKCRELGIGELSVGVNLFGHRDFSATFCPGVLYARLGEIAERVNANLRGEDDMTDDQIEKVAEAAADKVWRYMLGSEDGDADAGNYMREIRRNTRELTRTDDPTGRGSEHTMQFRLAFVGARLDEIEKRIEQIAAKVGA